MAEIRNRTGGVPIDPRLPRPNRNLLVILLAILARWVSFVLMTIMAVWNEGLPGRKIDDPLLAFIPYVEWVERTNYTLWLVAWIPPTLLLLAVDRARFVRLMIAGSLLSILRGISILIVPLGPVRGQDLNLDLPWDGDLRWEVIARILDPWSVFFESSANIWLTKDLFFSGHTATTFLLLLYVWPIRWLRGIVLLLHGLVVASLFFAHLHYTVDVLGAYFAAGLLFWVVERASPSVRRSSATTRSIR